MSPFLRTFSTHCLLPLTAWTIALLAQLPWAQRDYRLSGDIVAPPNVDGDVVDAALAPDGRRVVYLADQERNDVVELYSVPSDAGATPVRLNDPLPFGESIHVFHIAPGGKRVLFTPSGWSFSGLFAVPIDHGAPPFEVNGPLAGGVLSFQFTPDGKEVLYLADQDTRDLFELHVGTLGRGRRSASSSTRSW